VFIVPPKSVRSGNEFSQIDRPRVADGPPAWPKVTWTTWDDGDVVDNASGTAAGPNREPAAAPAGDDTDKAGQVEAPRGGSGRGRSGLRDVVMSMIVLVVVILALAAISHSCSFSPGGPSVDSGSLPTVDVSAELQAAAAQVRFPLREPTLPDGWRPNSNSVDSLGPKGVDQAVRIGVLTDSGHYLQVTQSDATVADLVRSAAGLDDQAALQSTGGEVVNGTKWTVYPGVRSESSWVTDLGTERLFITGNGTTAEFRTLAAATLTGRRVTAPGGP
jgi:hypothetical protein